MITKNYGRLGGELDNGKYLEAGARATCNPRELRLAGFVPAPAALGRSGHSGLIGGDPAPFEPGGAESNGAVSG